MTKNKKMVDSQPTALQENKTSTARIELRNSSSQFSIPPDSKLFNSKNQASNQGLTIKSKQSNSEDQILNESAQQLKNLESRNEFWRKIDMVSDLLILKSGIRKFKYF